MNISKKLFLTATLGLCLPFVAQAYNSAFFQEDTDLIVNFAQDLRRQNSTQAQIVATWLEKKAMDPTCDITSSDMRRIVTIVTIEDLTIQSKLAILSEKMKKEISDSRKRACGDFVACVCSGIFFAGFCTLATWAIIEDIRNPRPIVYVQPKPGVSITWTTRQPSVSYYYR